MRIAHLSDLHLVALAGAVPFRLFNKRFTGYVNLKLRRGALHQRWAAEAVAAEIRAQQCDHVVVTGDVSNLSLEREFEAVRDFLRRDLRLPADQVSLVPGNHDVYTRGAYRSRRFDEYLGDYTTGDLPEAALTPGLGHYPYVRLRGPVSIIGLSTAVPRLPLVASGRLGEAQRRGLQSLLAHREVRSRTPVILQHHPVHPLRSPAQTWLKGLSDGPEELEVLRTIKRGLVLHGHLHRRIRRQQRTDQGHLDVIGTTSASLVTAQADQTAGFNVYEVDDIGELTSISAFKLQLGEGTFQAVEIPLVA